MNEVGLGVSLDELYCPTCGRQFTDFHPYAENAEEVFDVDRPVVSIKATPTTWRRFLICPNGHRWTVTKIWMIRDRTMPDRVQLGEYLQD